MFRAPIHTILRRSMAIKRPGSTLGLKPKTTTLNPAPVEKQPQQYNEFQPQNQQYPPNGQYHYDPNTQMQPMQQFPQLTPQQMAQMTPAQMQQYQQQQMQFYQQQQAMMQQQQQANPSLGQRVAGGIMEGMTFGVGSAVAHRAVDAMMGPRTIQHEFVGAGAGAATAAGGVGDAAAATSAAGGFDYLNPPVAGAETSGFGNAYEQPAPMFDNSQFDNLNGGGAQESSGGGFFGGGDDSSDGDEDSGLGGLFRSLF